LDACNFYFIRGGGIKKPEFYAEFKFIENVARNFIQEKLFTKNILNAVCVNELITFSADLA
jgi:hypothetical protein